MSPVARRQESIDDVIADFGGFVRRHQARLRVWLRRLVNGDATLADDLAQEAFLRAYRARHGFRGEASAHTWLVRIALSAWQDHQRSQSAWPVVRWEEGRDADDTHPDAPVEEDLGLRMDVDRALNRLTPAQRAVVIHACWADMSQSEIAQALDLPLGSVKTHYRRAMRRLAADLEDRA